MDTQENGRGGWNKGKSQFEAFKAANPHHGSAEFLRGLNTDPTNMQKKRLSHELHEKVVVRKQAEFFASQRIQNFHNWGVA
ncbi:MAG TPA: hypothetical protein VJN71_07405 [Nitrososphaerales archaeon]|nr:hypothetical protein [Nitrososphaerales archaeon]